MANKEKFHCHQAASKGFQVITEDYCLIECDSPQKGAKAECPDSVRPQPPGETPKETKDSRP